MASWTFVNIGSDYSLVPDGTNAHEINHYSALENYKF